MPWVTGGGEKLNHSENKRQTEKKRWKTLELRYRFVAAGPRSYLKQSVAIVELLD